MATAAGDILACAAGFQAAALNDRLWPEALELLRRTFDAPGAALEVWNAQAHDEWSFETAGVDLAGAAKIAQLYPATNPRLEANRGTGVGEVTYDYRHFTEDELERLDFVRDMEAYTGTRYYMSAIGLRGRAHMCTLTLFRDGSQGHFAERQISAFRELLPTLSLSLRTALYVGKLWVLESLDIAESSATGIILMNERGRILYINPAAEALLSCTEQGAAHARPVNVLLTGSHLQKLIGQATEGTLGATRQRWSGKDLTIVAMPVTTALRGLAPLRPRVAVVLKPTDAGPALKTDLVKAIFSLTPREIEVAHALMRGLDLSALSASIGMSPGTARVHIRNILAKTETHSQREAVSALLKFGGLN